MILRIQEHPIWGQSLSHGQNVFDRCRACGVGCWNKKQTGSKAVRLAVRAARCAQNEVPAIADALQ